MKLKRENFCYSITAIAKGMAFVANIIFFNESKQLTFIVNQ